MAENAEAPEMQKSLSLFNFFTIGFGAIIGTGWVLLVGDWMVLGGGPFPAMIAFAIGAIFLVPIGCVFGELTAAIPISGGIIEYVDRTFGRPMGFFTGWMLLLGNAPLFPRFSPTALVHSLFFLGLGPLSSTPFLVQMFTCGQQSSLSALLP